MNGIIPKFDVDVRRAHKDGLIHLVRLIRAASNSSEWVINHDFIAARLASLLYQTAKMQDLDWNDLRYILCLSRMGRIVGAARKLGVNETTVARRIARVERLLVSPLVRARFQASLRRPTAAKSLSVMPSASNSMSTQSKTA